MNIDPEQWQALRDAASEDDHQRFERLVAQIVQQAIRNRRARREATRPVRPWPPEYV